jgi:cyclomaltodextrinase
VTRIASAITDERHLPHALAVLFTVAGTPSVYYGDEQAFRGVKEHRAGGDDAVRPAFPADRADLAPFGWPTYHVHQELIGLRRRHPWLHRARTRPLQLTNTTLVLEASAGEHRLVVALDIGDEPLDHDGPGEVLAGHAHVRDGGVTVPPHGWAVLG